MFDVFKNWYRRNFSDPQAVILAVLLLFGLLTVIYMGGMLAPILIAIGIAYMLEAIVELLEQYKMPRLAAVVVVCLIFLLLLLFLILLMIPILSQQITQLIQELPNQLDKGQQALLGLPESYPEILSESQVNDIVTDVRKQITSMGQAFLSVSLSSIPILFAFVVYCILVPILVFIFLKDKDIIINCIQKYFPKQRGLEAQVWHEMD